MIARLHKATQNATATLLMMRVAFYCHLDNGGVLLDGRRWTYRSVDGWADEIGDSPDKVERAMKLLREANLISTRMAWVGKGDARRWLLHVALTPRTESVLKGEDPQICGEGSCKSAGGGPANLHLTIEPGEQPGEQPGDPSELSLAVLNGPVKGKGFAGEGDQPVKMEDMLAAETWKEKASKLLHKPNTPSSLELIWKQKFPAVDGKKFVSLTKEDWGRLSQFRKKVPPGNADAILTWVLDNWDAFTKHAEDAAGLKQSPSLPSIGFLLKHVSLATMLWSSATSPKKQEAPTANSVLKPVQLISQEPPASGKVKLTQAELWADPDEE